jgi:AraC-like DNA-binding protein
MDPLDELLRAMRLTGAVFLQSEFTSPWCIKTSVGPAEYGTVLAQPSHVIAYHYVTEGHCLVEVEGHRPIEVRAGELVLLPHNDPHRLGSDLRMPAVTASLLVTRAVGEGLGRIVHGGGGERTRIICGFLGTDTPSPPIATVLPAALTIPIGDGPAGDWIESSLEFAQGLTAAAPAVLARLAELLFVESVRRHMAALPAQERGPGVGLGDPIVGQALTLLHARNNRRWTVPTLARELGASRSAFADRFTSVMGESPMRYLARHRLRRAADWLREKRRSVTSVALDAGYRSEAAFSRAFKREFGQSPARWRAGQVGQVGQVG